MMFPLMMKMLVLLLPLAHAAPKDGALRLDPEVQHQPLLNPFQPGQEQLRLLQSYLKGLQGMEEEPDHMSREQVLLYLVALHDYDQSGHLDGLELLSMLTAALAPGAADSPAPNPVILVVDKVLETQDLNGDGLMTPGELINFPGEAPSQAEPREPLEPQDIGRQPLSTKIPSGQEAQEAPDPRDQAGGPEESRRGSVEPAQEAGGPVEAEGEAPGPGGETGHPAEAEGEAPGPGGETEGQAEAPDTRKEAEELPQETLESRNTPDEFEAHAIQLENDEM
ncbi:cell growth regulator with EF hand domain protein 1 [Talpa occidentalis]|uniref:cell growth regulator with EF hand domain protein 1 n=1 Tax=Talpa occidentalis TaxID=50954 RepID=UPI0018900FAF|nr:cell growth regulator with EF hand domain protein 1 [Talpa occidentalis]XP_037384275.1 cell growth regulator with EF hand domain protein 1 [Talpa occidentalis]XP_037384276.1 cell growth regulator with EF hand domain protein 1 [Talpa occidentalis]XP_037384277.1 cell growth regulator with EF hand domain protein 1 [Talpa occidentalis]